MLQLDLKTFFFLKNFPEWPFLSADFFELLCPI